MNLFHYIKLINVISKKYSKRIFIDTADSKDSARLNELGYEVHSANLIMNNTKSKNSLADEIIQLLESR